jgi:hypothetical protein
MRGGHVTARELPDLADAVDVLSSPPTNDDLDDLLEAAAPRRRSKLTVVLVAALVFVIGFLAGSVSEKLAVSMQQAQQTTADGAEPTASTVDSDPTLVGHVLMVDDGVIYVERLDGASVKVRVSDGTVIGLSVPGRADELVPGDAVIIHGEIATDGTIDASSIQQSRPRP